MSEADVIQKYLGAIESRFNKRPLIAKQIKLSKGDAIADLLVNFCEPVCIEIKSNKDSLARLRSQIPTYSKCFKKTYLLVEDKHLNKAISSLPTHIGVMEVLGTGKLFYHRPAMVSPDFDYGEILGCLWKDELIRLLIKYDCTVKSTSLTKNEMVSMLRLLRKKRALYYDAIAILFDRFRKLEKLL